ncbi:MAG TPA: nitroreductase family protein, partial [Methylomirabilota bacterium]|nr:nitroreductase family protein [Methylomirabilota bacterium]
MAEMDLFEAIYTARAIRRFKPDPVPDEVITKVLDAAIRAPSGSNEQSWEFIVVKDAAQRKKIGDVYR